MILLKNIRITLQSKTKTTTVLADSINLESGELGALVGENGKGKTTLLRAAAGSIIPGSGIVQIDKPVIAFTDIERQVHHRLTLVENHFLFSALYGLKRVSRKKVAEHLRSAGLFDMRDKKAGSLSKGEKARLVFSIVDAFECASFIIDEPTNGLDDNGKQFITHVITQKLATGATGLISTHDREFLAAVGAVRFELNGEGVFSRKQASNDHIARPT